jgi:DNA topoisomerase-1
VQSAALRLVVDRGADRGLQPRGIGRSTPSSSTRQTPAFLARLVRIDGKKRGCRTRRQSPIVEDMAAYRVAEVKRSTRVRRPFAPFTTSTLQQSPPPPGFTARKTMAVASSFMKGWT